MATSGMVWLRGGSAARAGGPPSWSWPTVLDRPRFQRLFRRNGHRGMVSLDATRSVPTKNESREDSVRRRVVVLTGAICGRRRLA